MPLFRVWVVHERIALTYRIGGDFEIGRELLLSRLVNDIAFPGEKKHVLCLDTGRSAVYIALLTILQDTSLRKAWLPGYCCPTVITPFRQLGFDINFYSMGNDLSSPAGLPDSLNNSVILFIHYFGKRNRPLTSYIEDKRECGDKFFIIEDCVQTCLSQAFGVHGDFVVHSLRKFLPVPDGGILCSDLPIQEQLELPDETYISKKILAKLIRGLGGRSEDYLNLYGQAEVRIDNEICPRRMSMVSDFILPKLDLEKVAERRIMNWNTLSGMFKNGRFNSNLFHPLFPVIGDGEIPLAFPVIVKKGLRGSLRDFLAKSDIFCPIHWKLDQKCEVPLLKDDCVLSQSILSIPIDQRVSERALAHLTNTLNQFNG